VRRPTAAIGRLSEEHRTVLELMDLDGLALEEVARRLARSPDAVRMLRKRALLRLGQLLGES
jgi:DNA-directed RNA polymerase specialized sigma24 family protein